MDRATSRALSSSYAVLLAGALAPMIYQYVLSGPPRAKKKKPARRIRVTTKVVK